MSRVSECLKQILSARYGKDVRQSIHDGIKELDEVARTAQGSATLSAQTAIEKANEALTASQAAIESAQQAKAYSDNAQAVAGVQVATQDNAGLVKGGENHIGLDGTLELVVNTTEASMPNSRKGILAVDEIGGVCVQDNIPSPDYPQEIKKSVVSEIKTHDGNGNESVITLSQPIDLYHKGDVQDVIGDGKVKQRFKKAEFDGSSDEIWVASSLKVGRYYVDELPNSKLLGSAVCTHSIHNKWATDIVNNSYFSESVSGRFIINTSFATLDEWKAHLAEHPMTVVYELAEEVIEDLPIADQIALNSLETFDGATYIEFDSEVQPTFKGKYGTSLVGGIALEAYNKAHTHSRTVLWTNSDKTQPIEARTVLLPLSLDDYEQYEFYLITYCNSTASEFAEKQVLMARAAGTYNGNNVILGAVIKEGDTYHQHERNLAYSFDSNAFTVAQCTYLDASFKAQAAHDKLIPYQIIGIK